MSGAQRGTWVLVALLVASAVAESAAALRAGIGVPVVRRPAAVAATFGPPDPAAAPVPTPAPSLAGASVGQVLRVAPVLPPAPIGAGPRPVQPRAPAAQVRPARPAAPVFRPADLLLPNSPTTGSATARVVPVGLHPDGSLVIPDDPRVAGWWTGGAMAGEPYGSVVLAGHVDSARRGVGVLAGLAALRAGDVVEVAGGGLVARYRVLSAQLVPQARLDRASGLFRADGPPQLVLVTCGGAFDPVRHRYADNYVVVARPVAQVAGALRE